MYTGKYLSLERSGIIGKSRDYNDYCCLCRSRDRRHYLVQVLSFQKRFVKGKLYVTSLTFSEIEISQLYPLSLERYENVFLFLFNIGLDLLYIVGVFSELNNKRGIIKLVSPNGKGTFAFVDSIHIALPLSIAVFLFVISVQNRIIIKKISNVTVR